MEGDTMWEFFAGLAVGALGSMLACGVTIWILGRLLTAAVNEYEGEVDG